MKQIQRVGVLVMGLAAGCANRGRTDIEASLRGAGSLELKPLASCAETEEPNSREDTPRIVLDGGASDGNDAGLSDGGGDAWTTSVGT